MRKKKRVQKLKIPTKIKIAGAVWKIKLVDKLDHKLGDCNSETRVIRIKKLKNLSVMEDTLFHEILHSMVFTLSSPEYNWEKVITPLSRGLKDIVNQFQKLK